MRNLDEYIAALKAKQPKLHDPQAELSMTAENFLRSVSQAFELGRKSASGSQPGFDTMGDYFRSFAERSGR